MSRTSRVFNIVSGVLMIICSWILFRNPDVGLEFADMILGAVGSAVGIRKILVVSPADCERLGCAISASF